MIELSGLNENEDNPDEDVEIKIIGLRAGESFRASYR